jgi:hypothetical protein
MIERRIVGLLLTVMATYVLAAAQPVAAQNRHLLPLRVRVDSVLAANTGKGMDPDIDLDIADRLRSMFDYTTYRLVIHQELETVCGRSVNFEMPGQGILHIAPRSIVDNMISLEVVLFEGPHPLMSSDLRMINHAVLMVGGPHYLEGTLITIITVGSADSHSPRHHLSMPPGSTPPAPPQPLPGASGNSATQAKIAPLPHP